MATGSAYFLPRSIRNIYHDCETIPNEGAPEPASIPIDSISLSDGLYVKAILKEDVKMVNLNSDSYQSWADGMERLLGAKMLWPVK